MPLPGATAVVEPEREFAFAPLSVQETTVSETGYAASQTIRKSNRHNARSASEIAANLSHPNYTFYAPQPLTADLAQATAAAQPDAEPLPRIAAIAAIPIEIDTRIPAEAETIAEPKAAASAPAPAERIATAPTRMPDAPGLPSTSSPIPIQGWDEGYSPPADMSSAATYVPRNMPLLAPAIAPVTDERSLGVAPSATIMVTLPAAGDGRAITDIGSDPVLGLVNRNGNIDAFRKTVGEAIAQHPATGEAIAGETEAEAAKSEAISGRLPTVDVTLNSYQTISRAFSNDPQNVIERSRARSRTDATLAVSQPIYDFGATGNRVASARSRVTASKATIDDTANRIAIGVVASHYDVFGYRALLALSQDFGQSQRKLRDAVDIRIRQGVSAAGDIAQVDSYIGSADRRVAETVRQLASAEARYTELVGAMPEANLQRIPSPVEPVMSKDMAQFLARSTPNVVGAEALAEAGRREARAAQAALLPNVSAGIDAGRYGVIENKRDYDIRARITLRQRFLGGGTQRANQARARADAATARADRVREEAARDASIAWSDVKALEDELSALQTSYLSSRRSRDVLLERFKVSRGTLFDVLAAEDNLFQSAAAYIRTLTQLDTARYILLSRTGQLLGALAIPSAQDPSAQ